MNKSVYGFSNLKIAENCLFSSVPIFRHEFFGGGVLPENVHSMHLIDLPGPYVL